MSERVPRAFTLIEVAVTLLLMSLLAGAATLSLSGVAQERRADDAIDRLITWDMRSRARAVQSQQAFRLHFDVGSGDLTRLLVEQDQADEPAVSLPRGWVIEAVWHAGQWQRSGWVDVPLSSQGLTGDYAVQLRGPNDHWVTLGIWGLTGEAELIQSNDWGAAHDTLLERKL